MNVPLSWINADVSTALKMGSAWLPGPDTLDMKPVFDEGYPLQGKVALPMMVKAQFAALSSLLMTGFQRDIESSLKALETASDWQVFFVVVAVLGDLVSRMKSDRMRHARQRGIEGLYTEPESVTMAEAGLKEVVARFRRFQKRFDVPRVRRGKSLESGERLAKIGGGRREVVKASPAV